MGMWGVIVSTIPHNLELVWINLRTTEADGVDPARDFSDLGISIFDKPR